MTINPFLERCNVHHAPSPFSPTDDSKTLMFFEGCPPQLGCTIKLRGASEYELARVKEIIILMVCVAYHSQLEISFLMDEFAMPPSLAKSSSFPCLLESTTAEEEEEEGGEAESRVNGADSSSTLSQEADASLGPQEGLSSVSESAADEESSKVIKSHLSSFLSQEAARGAEPDVITSTPLPCPLVLAPPVSPPFLIDDLDEGPVGTGRGGVEGEGMLERGESREENSGSETPPRLFRDPLQDDTGLFVTEQVASSDDRLKSLSAGFKQELKDIILCISPFITFREPFLLIPAGLRCPSRDYFPEQVGFHISICNKILWLLLYYV